MNNDKNDFFSKRILIDQDKMIKKECESNYEDFKKLISFPFFRLNNLKQETLMKSDIIETSENYIISIDMPGFDKDNIKIITHSETSQIEIIGKRIEKIDYKNQEEYLHKERYFGECIRKFYIGNVKKELIKAKYNCGVLELIIPKVDKESNKQINIQIDEN